MKHLASYPLLYLAAMLSLAMVGCAPSAKDKLVGKWQGGVVIDDAAVQQRLDETGNKPLAKAFAQKAIEAFESGTLDIEFKADDSYTSSTKLGPLSKTDFGTWEIVDEQPTQATVRFTSHEGNVQDATVQFSDTDVIASPLQGNAAGLGEFRCTRVQ